MKLKGAIASLAVLAGIVTAPAVGMAQSASEQDASFLQAANYLVDDENSIVRIMHYKTSSTSKINYAKGFCKDLDAGYPVEELMGDIVAEAYKGWPDDASAREDFKASVRVLATAGLFTYCPWNKSKFGI